MSQSLLIPTGRGQDDQVEGGLMAPINGNRGFEVVLGFLASPYAQDTKKLVAVPHSSSNYSNHKLRRIRS